MDRFIKNIEHQISELEEEYTKTFNQEISRSNSSTIGDISKILELIRNHKQSKGIENADGPASTLHKMSELCISNAKREFVEIEEELFKIPIRGNE